MDLSKITKEEALTSYVLFLIMWQEFSEESFYYETNPTTGKKHHSELAGTLKAQTAAAREHFSRLCEPCAIAEKISEEHDWKCDNCPFVPETPIRPPAPCLLGMYYDWRSNSDPKAKAISAEKILNLELKDWFKKLIGE